MLIDDLLKITKNTHKQEQMGQNAHTVARLELVMGTRHTFCEHGHFWHALFQIFLAWATWELPIPEISVHVQGFSIMPNGMPYIFGNF